jgi:hypothetical protein
MSQSTQGVTISGGTPSDPSVVNSNYTGISLVSGDLIVTGGYDNLVSGVSNVGIVLKNVYNNANLSGNNDNVNFYGGYGNNLVESGNNNLIEDTGFNEGGVTLIGSYNTLTSNSRMESADVSISGNHNSFDNAYLVANLTVSGNYDTVNVGSNSKITITGNDDTITVLNASTIFVTGINDTVIDEYLRDEQTPQGLSTMSSSPPVSVSVSGAGNDVQLSVNNVMVNEDGTGDSISSAGDLTTIVAAGNGVSISTNPFLGGVSVSGANSSVSTTLTQQVASYEANNSTNGGLSPVINVNFSGNASLDSSFSDGTPGSVPTSNVLVSLTLKDSNTAVDAELYQSVTDYVGGNTLTINGSSQVNVIAGNDSINVVPMTYVDNANISGSQASNTINLANNDLYNGASSSFISSDNTVNLTGNDDVVIYDADQDTVNALGGGNILILEANSALPNPSLSQTAASGPISINGASTALIETSSNNISASNGAVIFIDSGNNTITGQGISADIGGGAGNQIVLTGSDSVTTSSPYSYQTNPNTLTEQNFLTVQSGQFSLGGLDTLTQVNGTAAVSLFGGNKVTLNGDNDTVSALDQIYGGNTIVNNGANNTVNVINVNNSSNTIDASANTLVNVTDNTGSIIGAGINTNVNEKLMFIATTGTSNTVFGAGSQAEVTLFGGQSSGNVAYGGNSGGNSLNGGSGGSDYFVGGGNGDVLVGGSQGSNTLIAGAGNETMVGANLGNDAFSVSGGGGSDIVKDFSGSLTVNGGLTVVSETNVAGSMVVTLNDRTQITFSGITQLNQDGNVFSLTKG